MMKCGYKRKPVVEQGRNTIKAYLVVFKKKRIQGEDFTGHHFQAQSSPSENFRALSHWYKPRYENPKRTPTDKSVQKNINPETIADTTKKIGRSRSQLAWK